MNKLQTAVGTAEQRSERLRKQRETVPGAMNPGPTLPQLQFSNTDPCMCIRALTWENISNGTYSEPLEEASVYESFDILLERCLPTHKIDTL